jgi:NADPH:quinone reductase-like Zn-dependent oxidoreductase
MTESMRAIRFHDYGGPEVLKIDVVPRPAPKDDEILIHAQAWGVNPVDWKIREGHVRKRINIALPAIPGGDIAGVVAEVGAQVTDFSVGQAVFAMVGLLGANAEYVAVKAAFAAPAPATLDGIQAASVPLAALTAYQALFEHGGLQAGQRALVHAAAGGVGGFAVQLACSAGAEVVGTASAANADYVRGLGAAAVIDYRSPDADLGSQGRFDLVLDLVGGDASLQSLRALQPGGLTVGVAPPSEALQQHAAAAQVRVLRIQVHPDGRQLREIATMIDAGKVGTTIAAVYSMNQVGIAHEQSKTGHTRGKIVVQCLS